MATLSVVISAFNEESKIKDCLESVKWAEEIIFVDNTSQDKTVSIAKEYTEKIFIVPNNLMLNVNKNFGFRKATGDWILSLDADERVTSELKEEIKSTVYPPAKPTTDGYYIPRKNIIFGKWIQHSIWWPDEQLRLLKNGKGKFPEKSVHELLEISGQTKHLKNSLVHQNYFSISQYLYKMDKIYSENEASNFIKSGKKINWSDAVSWPISDFLKTFFAQEGYKDGLHGLVLSLLQAFYTLVVFAKIWEKQGFEEEQLSIKEIGSQFKKSEKEINYWLWESKIRTSNNPLTKLFWRVRRRLSK